MLQLFQLLLTAAVLDRLIQTTQTVQNKAVQITKLIPEYHSLSGPFTRIPDWNEDADCQITAESKKPSRYAVIKEKDFHHQRGEYRDGDRGNRMSIEHLQKLNVRCQNRDQISLIFAV